MALSAVGALTREFCIAKMGTLGIDGGMQVWRLIGGDITRFYCTQELNHGHKAAKRLSLFRPMEFSINFDAVKSGWSIIYIEGLLVIISPQKLHIVYFYIIIDFVFAHSEEPEITHYAQGPVKENFCA